MGINEMMKFINTERSANEAFLNGLFDKVTRVDKENMELVSKVSTLEEEKEGLINMVLEVSRCTKHVELSLKLIAQGLEDRLAVVERMINLEE